MAFYKDIISGDTILSDAYRAIEVPGGVLWEVNCNLHVVKRSLEAADSSLGGANPSAEDGDFSSLKDGPEVVLDLQADFGLLNLGEYSKREFRSRIKSYMLAINNMLVENGASEEEVEEFQAGAVAAVNKILGNYNNYEFFIGPSMNFDGMVVLIGYREDGKTPFATFWKHGLFEETA
ncbi:TCTP family protein [Chaetomium sp. MPI-CAGE-AT-0009]|nr:TCTP family protein [Chaetomium sp. MPI-CAGE-AT-0009]